MDINLPCIAPFVIADSALAFLIWRSRRQGKAPVRLEPAGSDEPVLVIGGLAARQTRPPAGFNENELSGGVAPMLAIRKAQPRNFDARCGFAVSKVLADAGIGFRPFSLPGERPQPITGPRNLTFLVKLDRPGSLNKALSLSEQVAMEAGVDASRVARYQDVVGFEFPLPTNRWKALELDRPGAGYHMTLGRNTLNRAVRLDIESAVHVLIAGETGAGKTWLLKSIVYQMALADPAKLKMLIIDGKQALRTFHQLPHLVAPAAVTPEQSLRALAWVAAEILHRGNPTADRTPLVVVIDELALLVGQDGTAVKWLKQLLTLGREYNVHTIAGTQRVTADVLGDKVLVDNFPTRLAGKVSDAEASLRATNRGGLEAHRLLGQGDFLRVFGGVASRFVASVVSQRQLDAMPRADQIIDVTANVTLEPLVQIETVPSQAPAETTPEQYAAVLAAWTHSGQWPGVSKIKELLKDDTGRSVGTARASRIQTKAQELAEALDRASVRLSAKEIEQ